MQKQNRKVVSDYLIALANSGLSMSKAMEEFGAQAMRGELPDEVARAFPLAWSYLPKITVGRDTLRRWLIETYPDYRLSKRRAALSLLEDGYSIKAVAQKLNVSERTIRDWRKAETHEKGTVTLGSTISQVK
ncbi:hypothetical protein GCM10023174_00800 [Chelativorans composti]|uniref:Helix-turn-helix domain-containing protein n=1 Tax=Chelativorans composti TaxID=768533 RepID=A0ABW5DB44_9HYPH